MCPEPPFISPSEFIWGHNTELILYTSIYAYLRRYPLRPRVKVTSSLLQLANCTTPRDETWYACILHHIHDNYTFPWWLHVRKLLLQSAKLLTVARTVMTLGTCACVLYHVHDNYMFPWRLNVRKQQQTVFFKTGTSTYFLQEYFFISQTS